MLEHVVLIKLLDDNPVVILLQVFTKQYSAVRNVLVYELVDLRIFVSVYDMPRQD